MEWFALYVKSRHEFITENELRKKGFETFLPSVKKLRYWKDRKKFIDFPLFPGYLFVNIYPDTEEFVKVLKTRGVVNFVSITSARPASVEPEEINSLKVLINSGKELDIYPNLREGAFVRIKRGVLNGAEGVLEKKGDQYIFLVNIKILGRTVGVKIPADDIECA